MAVQRTVGRPVNVRGKPEQNETRNIVQEKDATRPRRGKGLIIALVAVVALLAVAAVLLLRPAPGEAAAEEAPEPGLLIPVEPVSVNLADGHYLRLGFSVQLTADAHGELSTAQALDIAIALYSGRPLAEINDPATREQLKIQLHEQLNEAYQGEVMDVFLTDFVTQ